MLAVVHDSYGSFDTLGVRDVATPVPAADQVLVRVRAAGLHVGDCFGVRGAPLLMRAVTGWLRPKRGVPGYDFAGRVEAVGENVRKFRPGDDVFGSTTNGACVEALCVTEDQLAIKPACLGFVEAAALPTSALAALHGIRDVAKVQVGQKVLVNGASGGVGTFMVQIAKAFGAEVTGVCSTANVDMVRSIGADHVIDYTREDFTEGRPRFDVMFDNVENRSLAECRRAVTPTGTLVLNSGTGATGFAMFVRLIAPLVISPFSSQTLRRYLSTPNEPDLRVLADLVEAGKLKPVLDETFPLRETASALAHIESGHARGKVVVTM